MKIRILSLLSTNLIFSACLYSGGYPPPSSTTTILMPSEDVVVYFGDRRQPFRYPKGPALSQQSRASLANVCGMLGLKKLALLNPQHEATHIIDDINKVAPPLENEGDILLTDQKGVGLAVATADELPIVLVDPENKAIAIARASWHATAERVVQRAVLRMQLRYKTRVDKLHVLFGPCACRNCAAITRDKLEEFALNTNDLCKHGYGDSRRISLAACNLIQLRACATPERIDRCQNLCTCCDERFLSSQRQGPGLAQQLSVVAIEDPPPALLER